MNYKEYGTQNNDVIILLHGGGLSWWNYQEEAEILQKEYHVIIPILDGHAESDRSFTTIENNAAEIISFIDEKFGGSVLMIGGLSLGGQILLDILSQRGNICQYAVVESALVEPSRFIYSMIKPAIGSCYSLIQHQWFSKLQFKQLRIKQELFDDYYRDTCAITKQNMISFLQSNSLYSLKDFIRNCSAKTFIYVGGKENHAMQTSARIIHETLQGSSLQVFPRLYHGEFSINKANDYINEVYRIIRNC
ncbi:MAG: alpha/beta hydrolase [Hespellia sp.]|nr:alpha/beta hydrolase [Hespellia sp.]